MNSCNCIVTHTVCDGMLTENPDRHDSVTRGMIRRRAVDLAVISGRQPHETSKSDWEAAKRELIGLPET